MDNRDYEPDATYTVEGQFIIRFPEDYAKEIRQAIEEDSLESKLTVDMDINARFATVKWKDIILHGKMVDLPCIIESNKSIDKKSIYKTGDICQMLLCQTTPFDASSDDNQSVVHGGWTSKKFQWPHGLTPPLKNVRTRRFRRIQKKKQTDYSDVEKELRRLIQADISALSVEIEEVAADTTKKDKNREEPPTPKE
ncbi:Transcription initiation factor TFIID subunit 7 [Thelohanellus kitauei]|uniref:Transcription initiation factor TFIID subunit 7 n=1 Tax=Thelohanellus kitauei TaxID=669202 RepID=A0A0C2MM15_THEKT|nr:Transcription initiation factor TFIID subunit 7 [Thelohanellus kitauei]